MPGKYQKVAVHGLINNEDKYLVLHRSSINDYMPNKWDIPGGSTEHGEDPIQALNREVVEETGLSVEVGKPLFVYAHLSDPLRHQFQIVFDCKLLGGEIKLNPEEHDKFLWVTIDQMGGLEKIAFLDNFYKQLSGDSSM